MNDDCIISGSFIGEKASLCRVDEQMQDGFDSLDNDLGYELIGGVALPNRMKILKGGNIGALKDEVEIGSIHAGGLHVLEDLLTEESGYPTNLVQVLVIEDRVETIKAKGFEGTKGSKSILNFIVFKREVEAIRGVIGERVRAVIGFFR